MLFAVSGERGVVDAEPQERFHLSAPGRADTLVKYVLGVVNDRQRIEVERSIRHQRNNPGDYRSSVMSDIHAHVSQEKHREQTANN